MNKREEKMFLQRELTKGTQIRRERDRLMIAAKESRDIMVKQLKILTEVIDYVEREII